LLRQRHPHAGGAPVDQNPLRLGSAIQMTVAFALVLLAVPAAERLWGASGVLGSAALLGLTDMDALTYSMTRFGNTGGNAALAARAIAIGLLSNTLLKLALVLIIGSGGFRARAGAGLTTLALATLAGLLFWR
jgi:uncharacterized membrane protein (DUF4010 family)